MKRQRQNLLIAASLVLGFLPGLPAHAQYWGYSPYGYGSSFLWPLRAVLGPARAFQYGYGYNPIYLANSVLGTAMYRTMRPRPYMSMQDYMDEEPLNAPRSRKRPQRPADQATDEIVHAKWLQQAPAASQAPGAYAGNSMPFQQPAMPQEAVAQAPPAVAPPFIVPPAFSGAPPAQAPSPVVASAPPSGAPFAAGFVELVNQKFGGDIRDALFDPDARAWARSIGVIGPDKIFDSNLTDERVGLIQHVLKDSSVHPTTKVETVKLLLNGL